MLEFHHGLNSKMDVLPLNVGRELEKQSRLLALKGIEILWLLLPSMPEELLMMSSSGFQVEEVELNWIIDARIELADSDDIGHHED